MAGTETETAGTEERSLTSLTIFVCAVINKMKNKMCFDCILTLL